MYYWEEGHCEEFIYRISGIMHDIKFGNLKVERYKAAVEAIAGYAKDLAKVSEDWKEDIELTEESN